MKYKRINWTDGKTQFLLDNINVLPQNQIALHIGCSHTGIVTKMKNLNIRPTPEAIEKFRKESRFYKGHVSWNKGKKGTHFSPATEFKKGHKSQNTLYDGAITIRQNYKRGIVMKFIRMSEGNWIELQKYLWMQHHGPIPAKHVIRFKNGNTLDVSIDNLECISKAEHAKRNHNVDADNCIASFISRDPEVKQIIKNMPDLLDLKRAQLKLGRAINAQLD